MIQDLLTCWNTIQDEWKNIKKFPKIYIMSIFLSCVFTYMVVSWGYSRQINSIEAENILYQTKISYLSQSLIDLSPPEENIDEADKKEKSHDRNQNIDNRKISDAQKIKDSTGNKTTDPIDKCGYPEPVEKPYNIHDLIRYIKEQEIKIDYCRFLLGHKTKYIMGTSPILINKLKIKYDENTTLCSVPKFEYKSLNISEIYGIMRQQNSKISICRSMLELTK